MCPAQKQTLLTPIFCHLPACTEGAGPDLLRPVCRRRAAAIRAASALNLTSCCHPAPMKEGFIGCQSYFVTNSSLKRACTQILVALFRVELVLFVYHFCRI